jgi:hypothetical protein
MLSYLAKLSFSSGYMPIGLRSTDHYVSLAGPQELVHFVAGVDYLG